MTLISFETPSSLAQKIHSWLFNYNVDTNLSVFHSLSETFDREIRLRLKRQCFIRLQARESGTTLDGFDRACSCRTKQSVDPKKWKQSERCVRNDGAVLTQIDVARSSANRCCLNHYQCLKRSSVTQKQCMWVRFASFLEGNYDGLHHGRE